MGEVPLCGAVVFELARPGCAPDAVTLEAVTAAGNRPAERWRRTVGNAAGRTFEVAAPTGDPWPVADAAPPWWRTCQRRRPLAWYLMATGPDAPR